MLKRKFPRMQLEWWSFQIERLSIADLLIRQISRVSDDRKPKLPKMNPNLVSAPGAKLGFQQRSAIRKALNDLEIGTSGKPIKFINPPSAQHIGL